MFMFKIELDIKLDMQRRARLTVRTHKKRRDEEMQKKHRSKYTRRARLFKKDLLSARNGLMCKLKSIDFNHVCNLFLLENNKTLQKHQKIQNKKFGKLSQPSCESVSHDLDKVIYNFSIHNLTEL